MAMSRICSVSLVAAGLLLVLSSAAHAGLGWPLMASELAKTSAPPDLTSGLAVGWYFGSVAMLAFGVIALVAGFSGVPARGSIFWASLAVGVAYGGFGLATYAVRRDTHFLGFVAIGTLAVYGSVRALGRRGAA
jgi:hypothetical protein